MREITTTVLELVGLGLIVAGVAFVFWPAALVAAGIGAVFLSRGMSK